MCIFNNDYEIKRNFKISYAQWFTQYDILEKEILNEMHYSKVSNKSVFKYFQFSENFNFRNLIIIWLYYLFTQIFEIFNKNFSSQPNNTNRLNINYYYECISILLIPEYTRHTLEINATASSSPAAAQNNNSFLFFKYQRPQSLNKRRSARIHFR